MPHFAVVSTWMARLHNRLTFITTLGIVAPGNYRLDFALVAQQTPALVLQSVGWDWWYEPGQTVEVVEFGGQEIAAAGVDGPFVLRLASADYYPTEAITISLATARDLFTTAAYTASRFQSFLVTPTSETRRKWETSPFIVHDSPFILENPPLSPCPARLASSGTPPPAGWRAATCAASA